MAVDQHAYQRAGSQTASLTPADQPGPPDPAIIRARWDASQKATIKERRAYWLNSAMVSGEQWLTMGDTGDQIVELPQYDDRVRISVNRLKSTSRTVIAKLLRRPLVFEVAPTSADDPSNAGARIATAVVADVHHRHQWEGLRSQQAWATWKGGVSVLCTEWDPKAGTQIGATETGESFGVGDTVETLLDVTQVAAEPGCRDLEHGRWWIKAAALPPSQVKDLYKLDHLPPADATAMLSPLQRRLMGGSGTTVPLTLVLTYFERPGPDNPKGAVATMVADELVAGGVKPWPYPFTDRLNCVAVRETPIEDRWTGETILSDAVPVQVALNQSWSSIVEHMKLAGNARMKIPDGAGDEWDDLSDLPAELVRYTPMGNGQGPEWMSPPAMPEWWIEQPQQLAGQIDDILGVHDVSRGTAEQDGAHSGVALSILAEQDDTPLGLLAKESGEAWGRLATLVLRIYEKNVTESRKARVTRPGAAPETVQWSGKDLAGQTTAQVPLDAVQPRSRAAQMQTALALKAQFGPELDLKTFARIADLPGADDLVEAVDMDVVKAKRENGEMNAGQICLPAAFDDHAKHINEHNNFRKTARYEALESTQSQPVGPTSDLGAMMAHPEQLGPRDLVDLHIFAHETLAAEAAGQMEARAMVHPGLAAAPTANENPLPVGPSPIVPPPAGGGGAAGGIPEPGEAEIGTPGAATPGGPNDMGAPAGGAPSPGGLPA